MLFKQRYHEMVYGAENDPTIFVPRTTLNFRDSQVCFGERSV